MILQKMFHRIQNRAENVSTSFKAREIGMYVVLHESKVYCKTCQFKVKDAV